MAAKKASSRKPKSNGLSEEVEQWINAAYERDMRHGMSSREYAKAPLSVHRGASNPIARKARGLDPKKSGTRAADGIGKSKSSSKKK